MKILAIHSLAVHGTASLKAILSLLGTRVLPLPSLYLSGLTNIPGIIKSEPDFEALLKSTMDIARDRKERLILYIGYLGHEKQVRLIRKEVEKNRDLIDHFIVDPVSGDNGRTYVPDSVIKAWPELLSMADWAMPNYTELQLMSGVTAGAEEKIVLSGFQQRFPKLSFIGTSMPEKDKIRLTMFHNGIYQQFTHPKEDINYGGTGDVFTTLFIRQYFMQNQSAFQSMRVAAETTLSVIRNSMSAGSPDLILP